MIPEPDNIPLRQLMFVCVQMQLFEQCLFLSNETEFLIQFKCAAIAGMNE